mmetsp:Transcript_16372/g.51432  ORF Transcript_16372/g.51432 Transcript_16372/m.51432 type:complete len:203 (-) Transcript_16372:99-707(-)
MVPGAGGALLLDGLLLRHRHLVHRLHPRGDAGARAALPGAQHAAPAGSHHRRPRLPAGRRADEDPQREVPEVHPGPAQDRGQALRRGLRRHVAGGAGAAREDAPVGPREPHHRGGRDPGLLLREAALPGGRAHAVTLGHHGLRVRAAEDHRLGSEGGDLPRVPLLLPPPHGAVRQGERLRLRHLQVQAAGARRVPVLLRRGS